MLDLHVGSGTTRGALTVFPIWAERSGDARQSTRSDRLRLGELEAGPRVEALEVTNLDQLPVLLFEGQVLEGGWQTRMVARSTMIAPGGTAHVEVVCVEQGRWSGTRAHRGGSRRASARVRSGLGAGPTLHGDRQGTVWSRVAEYDGRYGTSDTSSYAELAENADNQVALLTGDLRPLPGQLGLVVAVAGHPVVAEVFDAPTTLRRQFRSVVEAAAIDAVGLAPMATPSRRARRLVDAARRVHLDPVFRPEMGHPEMASAYAGRNENATVTSLMWGEQVLHLVVTNPRHPLNT